ncbi:DNA polymerase III subunit beta [Alphaproteobacteria bacterium]|nr:DNA polymerase III subunit beta [Alphaproteobacteria bacterium]GHS96613.1 DNA polymerase III subunit beta [Alphaproteobacteria bacterium]
MYIRVNRDVLLNAFSHSQSVIEKRSTLLILGHTLLQARDGAATLVSTDMDMSLSETFACDVIREGELCIPTLLMYEILKKIKAGVPVELVFEDHATQIVLSAGRSRFEIPCIMPDEFPRILQNTTDVLSTFSLPAPVFKDLLETVRFAMSADEMRYSLVGINLSCDLKSGVAKLRAVATDRHRLASIEIPSPEGAESMPSVIVGKKTVGEMAKLLEDAVEPVTLSVSETRIELTVVSEKSRAVLGSRLIDGAFPDFEAILNLQQEKRLIAGTKIFAEAVDRVGTVINDKLRIVKIIFSRNLLKCSAGTGSHGAATEDIDIDYDDEDVLEFSYDVRYLLDIAQHVGTEELEISLTNPDLATTMRPLGREGVFFALMSITPQTNYTE